MELERDEGGGDANLGEILEANRGDADDGEEVGGGGKQPRHHHLPRPRGPERSAEGVGRGAKGMSHLVDGLSAKEPARGEGGDFAQ